MKFYIKFYGMDVVEINNVTSFQKLDDINWIEVKYKSGLKLYPLERIEYIETEEDE